MHGKWFPVLSALKPSFRKPHFLPAHLETTMCQLVRLLRWSKGCLFGYNFIPLVLPGRARLSISRLLMRGQLHHGECLGLATPGAVLYIKHFGMEWYTYVLETAGEPPIPEPCLHCSGLCWICWGCERLPWPWEGQGNWWERKCFQLPDVPCIKTGFSKMRKSQGLQSECRWKYSLIRSICFFWLARRGSILYSEVGNWWVQEDHTFSHLQIPPSTVVCSREGNSKNKLSLLFHRPGPRHIHLETSYSSLRRHSQAGLFVYLFSWELYPRDSQSKATRKESGIVLTATLGIYRFSTQSLSTLTTAPLMAE